MKINTIQIITFALSLLITHVHADNSISSEALIQKGDRAFTATLYKQALNHYQHASPDAADKPALYIKIARCFQRLGINHSALAVTKEILNNNASHIEALLIKGEVIEAQQDYEQALAIYQQVEQLDSTNVTTYYDQANVLRKLGRESDAEQALKKIKN